MMYRVTEQPTDRSSIARLLEPTESPNAADRRVQIFEHTGMQHRSRAGAGGVGFSAQL